MKKTVLILVFTTITFLHVSSQTKPDSSFARYIVDKSVADKVLSAWKSQGIDYWNPVGNAFLYMINEHDLEAPIDSSNARLYFDTLTRYVSFPCDCMIRNDTVFLAGGIAYEGGIGFNLLIARDFSKATYLFGDMKLGWKIIRNGWTLSPSGVLSRN